MISAVKTTRQSNIIAQGWGCYSRLLGQGKSRKRWHWIWDLSVKEPVIPSWDGGKLLRPNSKCTRLRQDQALLIWGGKERASVVGKWHEIGQRGRQGPTFYSLFRELYSKALGSHWWIFKWAVTWSVMHLQTITLSAVWKPNSSEVKIEIGKPVQSQLQQFKQEMVVALEKRNGQPQARSAVGVDRIRWWTQWDREI